MPDSQEHLCALAPQDWDKLEKIVRRFEEACQQGQRPELTDYLPSSGETLRQAALIELAHADLDYRLKAGEAARVESYLERYPDLVREGGAVLNLIAAEHELRREREPGLAVEEYARRFPEFREQLKARLQAPARPAPTRDARIGTTLGDGKYVIRGRLGAGGMGVVYEAEDILLERKVAIKLLPETDAVDPQALKRFLGEARAAARLNHPNVVSIFEVDQRDGAFYIVMELLRHGSVADLLASQGALSWPEATRMIADACRGVAAAHVAGLLHRDIKPANLMCSDGGGVKVADFGLAKVSNHPSLTGSGIVVGTPNYMSPEQCRGESLDERSDLYALGAAYFELLTGKPPFPMDGHMEVMFAHCRERVPDLRSTHPSIPEPCAAIVKRAMAKEPAQRYPSAAHMLTALEAVLALPGSKSLPSTDLIERLQAAPVLCDSKAVSVAVNKTIESDASVSLPGATMVPRKTATDKVTEAPRSSRAFRVGAVGVLFAGTLLLAALLVIKPWQRPPADNGNKDGAGDQPAPAPFGGRITHEGLVLDLHEAVETVAFSPDGKRFASGNLRSVPTGGGVTVWDYATGKEVSKHEQASVRSLAFSPNSETLAVVGTAMNPIRLLDLRNRLERVFLTDLREIMGARTVVFAPDGKSLAAAVAFKDGKTTVKLLDANNGKLLRNLADHAGTFYGLAFSRDGRVVASGGHDQVVKLYDPNTGKSVHEDLPTTEGINDLAFSPDGILAVACFDGVHLFDSATWKSLGMLGNSRAARSVAFSADGRKLALGTSDGKVKVFDFSARTQLAVLEGHQGFVMAVAFSPDGRTLASGSSDKTVRLWDISGLTVKEPVAGASSGWPPPRFANLSPDEQAETVAAELKKRNPDFDGRVWHEQFQGEVVELAFTTDEVTDIAPVQALKGLKGLRCWGSEPEDARKGKVANLEPLRGMQLNHLNFRANHVSDLRPLQGLPLAILICSNNRNVSDLRPLKGMQLTQLNVTYTSVNDLAPLQGMPLTNLDCAATAVSDLAALAGMKLTRLHCAGTKVKDLTPLQGMPLTFLDCSYCRELKDLTPLRDTRLGGLNCAGTQATDLTPLKDLPLEWLNCTSTKVTDFAPLKGMKTLKTINEKPAAQFWKENP